MPKLINRFRSGLSSAPVNRRSGKPRLPIQRLSGRGDLAPVQGRPRFLNGISKGGIPAKRRRVPTVLGERIPAMLPRAGTKLQKQIKSAALRMINKKRKRVVLPKTLSILDYARAPRIVPDAPSKRRGPLFMRRGTRVTNIKYRDNNVPSIIANRARQGRSDFMRSGSFNPFKQRKLEPRKSRVVSTGIISTTPATVTG